jgi:hypothetical protein
MERISGVRREQPTSFLELQDKHPDEVADLIKKMMRSRIEQSLQVQPETVRPRHNRGGTPENPIV